MTAWCRSLTFGCDTCHIMPICPFVYLLILEIPVRLCSTASTNYTMYVVQDGPKNKPHTYVHIFAIMCAATQLRCVGIFTSHLVANGS